MPRYFFHIKQAGEDQPDEDGTELPDLDAAREEAITSLRELIGGEVKDGDPIDHQEMIVKDEMGKTVLTLSFKDVAAPLK